jgi:hypothetical protein
MLLSSVAGMWCSIIDIYVAVTLQSDIDCKWCVALSTYVTVMLQSFVDGKWFSLIYMCNCNVVILCT